MKRYHKYKDSGISWLGQIPEHWEVRRIKYIFKELNERSVSGLETPLSLSKEHGIIPSSEKMNRTMESESYVGTKVVHIGNIVFNRFKARLFAKSGYEGVVSPDYAIYHCFEEANSEYMVHLFSTELYRDAFNRKASGIGDGFSRLYTDDLFAMYSIFPPLAEQQKIVDFLDSKISNIDSYISEKEKEVKLLAELKQSQIAQVVTKGINPNVPMKDSGISWIGQIPEHWEVCRMKKVFSLSKEKTESEDGTLLSLSQYTGILPKSEAGKTGMFEAESTIGYNVVHKGQFVMNIMLAWNGSYAVSDYEGVISPAYCVFNFNIDCNKKYFHYLLRLSSYAGAFKTMSKGIIESRLRLYPQYFLAFNTFIPPIEEQNQIVAYIESKCQSIDSMISNLESEIAYLKEYKQSLIADAVTGAINVQ